MTDTQPSVATALERLRAALHDIGPVVVAFSGGVDSSLLARVALDALGADAVLAATAVSPSLAAAEHEDCRRLADEWGLPWVEVATAELADARYRVNDGDRCYWCKSSLMDVLEPIAVRRGATVVLGVNLDDLADHRPGQRAAAERGACFPMVEAGLGKDEVRSAARSLGLRVWDKPAAPCLASRLPYGTEVSASLLGQIERAETGVRALGLAEVRVRHYGERARVELAQAALAELGPDRRRAIEAAVRAAGFDEVEIDPAGLRSGNLNLALR